MKMFEVGWWASLMNPFYNSFKGYWVKAEIVCRGGGGEGEGILKVSSAPASPIKILIVHIKEQTQRRPI